MNNKEKMQERDLIYEFVNALGGSEVISRDGANLEVKMTISIQTQSAGLRALESYCNTALKPSGNAGVSRRTPNDLLLNQAVDRYLEQGSDLYGLTVDLFKRQYGVSERTAQKKLKEMATRKRLQNANAKKFTAFLKSKRTSE